LRTGALIYNSMSVRPEGGGMVQTRKCWGVLLALKLAAGGWSASAQETPAETGSLATARSDAARFRARAEATLAMAGADKGTWGVLVTDADTGEVLYALNPERYFQPASNAKLFTTAMALATLGPEFRIRTRILTNGKLRAGRLEGDLVLEGLGDANLSNRVFPPTTAFSGTPPTAATPAAREKERDGPPEKALAELADQVVAHGVKEVAGDVIVDDSYLDRGRFPSGWTLDDTVWAYGAAISAIAVNDNALRLDVRPGKTAGAPLELSISPLPSIYQVRSTAVTTAQPLEEPQLKLSREPESRMFVLSGSLPLGAAPRLLQVAVQEPAESAALMLLGLLQMRGVRVIGHARARHFGDPQPSTPPGQKAQTLAERSSLPLFEDVWITNKMSLNLHAELMLRIAAREKTGAAGMDDALKFAGQFREKIGIAKEEVGLTDGSGLSRNDLVTPQAMVRLLAWAARQDWSSRFRSSLPVAGEDGTLENRMRNTAAAGRVQAKTGLTDHVEGLSGYATTVRGEHLIFSMFGNNNGIAGRDGGAVLDSICVAMVEELGPASAAAAQPTPQGDRR
jgi:D-alanyl-D-alanine carboxypeptidase/D-alanyl-D-alanine-endopeptidase (penicillin-binding protein 4)